MKHFKQLGFSVLITLLAWSCAERTICPAYQSAFIHDKAILVKHFSYFKEDSTPKILTASKNKFLIAEKQSYKKKVRSLNTVKMETIYPQLDDSIQLAGDIALQAEMDVVDSVALDSAAVNEIGWTEHFNVDQEFYFYYLNDILVYPEERELPEEADAAQDEAQEGEKQNFFQKLLSIFKKKPKTATNEDGTELIEEESTNESTNEEGVDSPPKKKKKLFSFGKKKKKKKKKKPTEEKAENKPEDDPEEEEEEEDEDDSF